MLRISYHRPGRSPAYGPREPPSACGTGTDAIIPVTALLVSTEARPMNASTYLAVTAEHHSKRSVLRLQGELDVSSRDHLCHAIRNALENHPPVLVMDLSGLSFTDCAGLSVLVWAHKRQAGCGHRLVITGAKPIIRRLLHLTGLDTYLQLSIPETMNDNPDETTYP
jgi:anti-sigma B factor antagonist